MGKLAQFYNNTNLEKEITEFYTGVEQSPLQYIKEILLSSIDEEQVEIEDNKIKIVKKGELHTKLIELLYKIPGKVVENKEAIMIYM